MGDDAERGDTLLATDTRVGDFRIRGFLGEGAMGQVYLAQDERLGRRVALKFIKRSVMESGGVERFLEEARATASFSHPHIVTLHAVGEHEGRPYLALEYIDGESLRARLAGGPLSIREAIRCCRAVAEAIAEAHRHGIVHADLKPENIVLARDGRVRVVDFGVAKLVGDAPHAASGTPAYMAPERWRGVPPTGAIDVWALGVTLHELIAGRRPIAEAVLHHLAFGSAAVELTDLPEAQWAHLVRDCLALDPEARPTAAELVRRLARLDPYELRAPRLDEAGDDDDTYDEDARRMLLLATHAQDLMTELGPEEVPLVRGVLIGLLDPDGGWRARFRSELRAGAPSGSREAVGQLIERLGERRLLIQTWDAERGDAVLEIGHEGIAAVWPQLAGWIGESMRHRRLAMSTNSGGRGSAAPTSPVAELGARFNTPRAEGARTEGPHAEGPHAEGAHTEGPRTNGARSDGARADSARTDDSRIDYAIERRRHEGFIGRAQLLDRLDELLAGPGADLWVAVLGGPGMGKTALLAAWLSRREAAGVAVPHHFIRRGEYDWDVPAKLVGSLVAQIEERFPRLREPPADARKHPAARLAAMLARVSANELVPRGERLVVVLDGLDEYDPPPGGAGDPLAAFLPHALPRGVSLLCASRPRHPHVSSLEARDGELVQIDLDDPARAADNATTVRAFWERAGPALGLDARFIEEAVACAGGNVQHAVTLQRHLAVLPPDRRRVETIPRGLAALLEKSWARIAADPVAVSGLGILCAAREALTLDELGTVAGWEDEARRRAFVRGARELLVEARRADGQAEYRLHHGAIRAHIAGVLGTAALRAHHAALAGRLATWPLPAEGAARRYALRHALTHRAEAGDWADAWRLAADMALLEAKCRELGAHEAEAEAARVAELCRAGEGAAVARRFGDLARALARESHWLRAAPEAAAALVWNRLRRSGWSADDADAQLRSTGAPFLRVRHGTTRASPALVRSLVDHSGGVNACAITGDARRVVSASEDGTLKVWDLESGRALATLEGHASMIRGCAVTADGQRVVSATDAGTLKVWDVAARRVIHTLKGHIGAVNACAVTADGRRAVSASDDRTLKVWDLDAGRLLLTLQGHAGWVRACAVTADGRRAVSASYDRTLRVWDLETGEALAVLEGHTGWLSACAVAADGRRAVSASYDRTLKVWDLEAGEAVATLEGHIDVVNACAVTVDGRRAVSASADRTLKVWDLEDERAFAVLDGHAGAVRACVATPDGRRAVSASYDRTLKVWDLASGRAFAVLEGHAGVVSACAVTADGQRAVSASYDRTLKVWDLAGGRELATLEGHTGLVSACAVTPDGRRAVSASADRTVRVWDLEAGRAVATLKGHRSVISACVVTADGRRAVSASWDRTLRVWDLERGLALATLEGHAGWVSACAVTADGRRAVSASDDWTVKVWDLATAACLFTHRGDHAFTAVAVTPAAIIAGDDAGAVWILDWPP